MFWLAVTSLACLFWAWLQTQIGKDRSSMFPEAGVVNTIIGFIGLGGYLVLSFVLQILVIYENWPK